MNFQKVVHDSLRRLIPIKSKKKKNCQVDIIWVRNFILKKISWASEIEINFESVTRNLFLSSIHQGFPFLSTGSARKNT
jgi:hypothetical protein